MQSVQVNGSATTQLRVDPSQPTVRREATTRAGWVCNARCNGIGGVSGRLRSKARVVKRYIHTGWLAITRSTHTIAVPLDRSSHQWQHGNETSLVAHVTMKSHRSSLLASILITAVTYTTSTSKHRLNAERQNGQKWVPRIDVKAEGGGG